MQRLLFLFGICWKQLNTIGMIIVFMRMLTSSSSFTRKLIILFNKRINKAVVLLNFVNWRKPVNHLVQFFLFFRLENRNLDLEFFFNPFIIQSSFLFMYIYPKAWYYKLCKWYFISFCPGLPLLITSWLSGASKKLFTVRMYLSTIQAWGN